MADDRLDLLRRMSAATPRWALVKNEESALSGRGDVDSAAPAADWPAVTAAVTAWADAAQLGPVLECDHIPGTLVIAVVEPGEPATLTQIDVLDHRLVRGRIVLRADDLLRSAELEAVGYRRLTPGAEAIARLLLDEWKSAAPAPPAASRGELVRLLRSDPDGARAAASSLPARLREATTQLAGGEWPRPLLLRFELAALLGELRAPRRALGRLARSPSRRACPLLHALSRERSVPGPVDEWVAAVHKAHPTGYS
jgi:hypothetical protein